MLQVEVAINQRNLAFCKAEQELELEKIRGTVRVRISFDYRGLQTQAHDNRFMMRQRPNMLERCNFCQAR